MHLSKMTSDKKQKIGVQEYAYWHTSNIHAKYWFSATQKWNLSPKSWGLISIFCWAKQMRVIAPPPTCIWMGHQTITGTDNPPPPTPACTNCSWVDWGNLNLVFCLEMQHITSSETTEFEPAAFRLMAWHLWPLSDVLHSGTHGLSKFQYIWIYMYMYLHKI